MWSDHALHILISLVPRPYPAFHCLQYGKAVHVCGEPGNEIHSLMMTFMIHLTWVTISEGLDRGLRLNLSLACQLLQNFWLQISALLPTLNKIIIEAIKRRNCLYRKQKYAHDPRRILKYTRLCNQVTAKLRNTKQSYFRRLKNASNSLL